MHARGRFVRSGQHRVGVGLLLQQQSGYPASLRHRGGPRWRGCPAPSAAAARWRPRAYTGLGSDGGIGRVQAPGAVVQAVENQRVQHLQRGMAHGAPMPAGLVGAAVEVAGAGAVPEAPLGRMRQPRAPIDPVARPQLQPPCWPPQHSLPEPASQPSRSTIRRTGRLLTPSVPVSSSTLPGRSPPHSGLCCNSVSVTATAINRISRAVVPMRVFN